MNPLLLWLAVRSLKPKGGYHSFAVLIAVLGVVVGVAALIIVNSVMTGFQDAIKKRLLSANADIIVMKRSGPFVRYDYAQHVISKIKGVVGVEPFIYVPAMATAGQAQTAASASIRGCVPALEPKVTSIPRHMVVGDWKLFESSPKGVVIGRILADTLGITVGDEITFISPYGRKTPFGVIPRTAKFTVVGIFEVGMYQFDSSLVLAHLDAVRKAFGFGDSVTGLMVKVRDLNLVKPVERQIEAVLGPAYSVQDWISLNKSLFSALKLEKLAMFLILTLIVVVASFNISSLLMMTVSSKSRDIAILKTVGAENGFIVKVFVLQGLLIGAIGTILGEAIGIAVSVFGEKFKLIPLPPDVYYIDHLPFQLHLADCVVAAVAALIISGIATVYPALRAAKTEPVKVLRMGES